MKILVKISGDKKLYFGKRKTENRTFAMD
jgi:hypothetical protein